MSPSIYQYCLYIYIKYIYRADTSSKKVNESRVVFYLYDIDGLLLHLKRFGSIAASFLQQYVSWCIYFHVRFSLERLLLPARRLFPPYLPLCGSLHDCAPNFLPGLLSDYIHVSYGFWALSVSSIGTSFHFVCQPVHVQFSEPS